MTGEDMRKVLGKTFADSADESKRVLVLDVTRQMPLEVFVNVHECNGGRVYFQHTALLLCGGYQDLTTAKNAGKRLVRKIMGGYDSVQVSGKTITGGHSVLVTWEVSNGD